MTIETILNSDMSVAYITDCATSPVNCATSPVDCAYGSKQLFRKPPVILKIDLEASHDIHTVGFLSGIFSPNRDDF